MKLKVLLGSAAFLAFAATTAMAEPDAATKIAVSYADLNLSSPQGRATLEHRIDLAVGRACPDRPFPSELQKQRANRECRKTAASGAHAQLAAIYGGRHLAQATLLVTGRAN